MNSLQALSKPKINNNLEMENIIRNRISKEASVRFDKCDYIETP